MSSARGDPTIDAQDDKWERLTMRACRRIGAIVLLLLTATGFHARVDAEPEHIRIQFSAAPKCPDKTTFVRAIRQRTGRFQLAVGAEQTRVFAVTITLADSLVSGRLEIQGPDTEVSLRNVSGKTCDEVMAALALMTALAIDPSAASPSAVSPSAARPSTTAPSSASATTPPPAGSSPRSPPVSEVPSLPPLASGQALPASTAKHRNSNPARMDPTLAPPPPSPVTVQSPPTRSSVPASAPWKWSAGVHGGVSVRVSPTAGLGGLLFVEAAAPVAGPVLRAGLFLNQSDVRMAEFQWAAAMVEGCPIRLVFGDSRVALYPCLAFHLGVLRGQGQNLDRSEKTTDLWSDLGPVARIRVGISARLFLEAQGMLVLPLRHLTFDVQDKGPTQPSTTVFTVPLLGARAGIGASYEFR